MYFTDVLLLFFVVCNFCSCNNHLFVLFSTKKKFLISFVSINKSSVAILTLARLSIKRKVVIVCGCRLTWSLTSLFLRNILKISISHHIWFFKALNTPTYVIYQCIDGFTTVQQNHRTPAIPPHAQSSGDRLCSCLSYMRLPTLYKALIPVSSVGAQQVDAFKLFSNLE